MFLGIFKIYFTIIIIYYVSDHLTELHTNKQTKKFKALMKEQ